MDPPWLGCPCCDSPMYPWAAPLLTATTANAGLFIQASKQVSAAAIDIWLASSATQNTRRLLGLRLRSYKFNLQESSTDWELFMRISEGQSHGIASCKTLSLGHGKCLCAVTKNIIKHLLDQSKQSVLLGKLFWSWQDCKRFQSCTKTEEQAFECTFQLFPEHMNQASDRYSTRAKHATERQKFLANRHPDRVKRMKVLPAKQKAHLFLLPGPGPRARSSISNLFLWRLQELSQVLMVHQHPSMSNIEVEWSRKMALQTVCALARPDVQWHPRLQSISLGPVHPCPPGISCWELQIPSLPSLGSDSQRFAGVRVDLVHLNSCACSMDLSASHSFTGFWILTHTGVHFRTIKTPANKSIWHSVCFSTLAFVLAHHPGNEG